MALYAEEYRRGSFAINAPTDHVSTIGGRQPESFESVVRRRIADQPHLRPGLRSRLSGLAGMMKIAFTPALDLEKIKSDRDYVTIAAPRYSQDTEEWLSTHTSQLRVAASMHAA